MPSLHAASVAVLLACIVALYAPQVRSTSDKSSAHSAVRAEIPESFTGAPVLTLEEMKYRVDIPLDAGGGTVLKPLLLAPKVGVRFRFDPITQEEGGKQWNTAFARKHSADIIPHPQGFPGGVHLVLAFSAEKQDEMIRRLNALLADPNVLDILPVVYVENREAVVTGVEVEFPVSFGERQLLQMLYAYGEVTDLVVKQIDKSGKWLITPKDRLFTFPARIIDRDGRRTIARRFDLNMLLLANLFEGERIAKEVPVRRARPVFQFLEPPVVATLAMTWSSVSIGHLRDLRLTVMVFDEDKVLFDPKRIPELGTEQLIPRHGSDDQRISPRPGWFMFADSAGVPTNKNLGWRGGTRATRTIGGRSVAVYEFAQFFYLFEPVELWEIGPLTVPYQLKTTGTSKPIELTTEAPKIKFHTFAHAAKEGTMTMPPPPSYALPGDVQSFIASPVAVAPKLNTHAFAPYVDRFGEGTIVASIVGGFLAALLSIIFSIIGARSAYRKKLEALPKPIAYPSKAEFERMCAALVVPPGTATEVLKQALYHARRIAEELLVRRVDGITPGAITTVEIKNIARDAPMYRNAMQAALAFLRSIDILDAPNEFTDEVMLRRALEDARNRLEVLYTTLIALPPLMTKGVPDGHSIPRHA